ncbi:hypothetical protein Hdeb2414_s0019g00540001 [Helianthus debilis subsp. tardiflorus]
MSSSLTPVTVAAAKSENIERERTRTEDASGAAAHGGGSRHRRRWWSFLPLRLITPPPLSNRRSFLPLRVFFFFFSIRISFKGVGCRMVMLDSRFSSAECSVQTTEIRGRFGSRVGSVHVI